MKPWDEAFWKGCINRDDFEELEEELWSKTTASEFYFTPANVFDEECIAITPAALYDIDGEVWDQHLQIQHLLPDDMFPMSEGVFNLGDRSLEAAVGELRRRGFKESAQFDAEQFED